MGFPDAHLLDAMKRLLAATPSFLQPSPPQAAWTSLAPQRREAVTRMFANVGKAIVE